LGKDILEPKYPLWHQKNCNKLTLCTSSFHASSTYSWCQYPIEIQCVFIMFTITYNYFSIMSVIIMLFMLYYTYLYIRLMHYHVYCFVG